MVDGTLNATLIWALVGIALVIAELLSGTFYLVILAIAAFAAAATSFSAASGKRFSSTASTFSRSIIAIRSSAIGIT